MPFTILDASGVAAVVVAVTNAVVAICVVLDPAAAVGAVGTPVNATSTIVLLVNVSVPAKVASVPEVGKVRSEDPEVLNTKGDEPIIEKLPPVNILPPNVIVLVPLLIPVPPLEDANAVVKDNVPALNDEPMTPFPLMLKFELDCCEEPLKI